MKLVVAAVFATLLLTLDAGASSGTSVASQDATEASSSSQACCQGMMAERQVAQTRLRELLDQLSSAEGDARIDAMSALLTELTEQQLDHMQHMEQMMGMMEQMMDGKMGGRDTSPEPPR